MPKFLLNRLLSINLLTKHCIGGQMSRNAHMRRCAGARRSHASTHLPRNDVLVAKFASGHYRARHPTKHHENCVLKSSVDSLVT